MAQTDSASIKVRDSTYNQWNVRLSPYVWLLGIKGEITLAPSPSQLPFIPPPPTQLPTGYSIYDIDLSFREVRNSLKFAIMLAGQYRFNRFITHFNFSSLVLESNAIAPFNYIFKNNTLNFAFVGGDLGAGYRILKSEKLEFDLLLGLKFIYFKVGLNTEIAGEKPISVSMDNLWVDPVLAINFIYRPHRRIELVAMGDIGAVLINKDFTCQFSTHLNFMISRHLYLSAGYRHYYVKIPAQEAIFSGAFRGMNIKFGVQF